MDRQSTTFILMKILRDSNENTNNEIQQQQSRFVQERFQRSSNAIDRCLQSSENNVSEITIHLLDIYTSIQQSRQRIENIRQSLQECKNLLVLKRQEIRKLWFLTCEQNTLVKIYENIFQLKAIPKRLEFYTENRLFLHASLLLLKCKEFSELKTLNVLTTIDFRLKEEKYLIEDQLCLELIEVLFVRLSKDFLNNRLNSSSRNCSIASKENEILRKRIEDEKLTIESEFLALIPEKYLFCHRSQPTETYLEILVQSLSILFHLNETLELIRRKSYEKLYQIVLRTAQHIINRYSLSWDSFYRPVDILRQLFQLSYEQFKLIVKNIEFLSNFLHLIQLSQSPLQIQQEQVRQRFLCGISSNDRKKLVKEISFEKADGFSIEQIWGTIEEVFVEVFHQYVDFDQGKMKKLNSVDQIDKTTFIDYSQYLTKKSLARSTNHSRLFQFSKSAQEKINSSFDQQQNQFSEQNQSSSRLDMDKQYVCKPNYRNITIFHDVLQGIIQEINSMCPSQRLLDRKVKEFIRDHFIGRVINEICQSAQTDSIKRVHPSDWIDMISVLVQKQLQLTVPIFQSTYLVWKSCEEFIYLVRLLPFHADEFCQAIVDLLLKHREFCNKLFLSIVQKDQSSGISIYSYTWIKDPDINNHLRQMPIFESFQFSNQQNKEAETLFINLNQNEIKIDDICTNKKQIELLAKIHESLHWLHMKLSIYVETLEQSLKDIKQLDTLLQLTIPMNPMDRSKKTILIHVNDQLNLSKLNLEIFFNSLKTISTLSDDILLVLFLEIRLHCFYYLSLLFRNSYTYAYAIESDFDENIILLNRDLTLLQETLKPILNEKKFLFLFQGLGCVLSTSLIHGLPRFSRISEVGVTKMCQNIFSIEQTLVQNEIISDGELIRARRFYEFLLTRKAEEILELIEENGNDYSEQDYLNLLDLQYRISFFNEDFHLSQYQQSIKLYFHSASIDP